jgi:hypothetical protein
MADRQDDLGRQRQSVIVFGEQHLEARQNAEHHHVKRADKG